MSTEDVGAHVDPLIAEARADYPKGYVPSRGRDTDVYPTPAARAWAQEFLKERGEKLGLRSPQIDHGWTKCECYPVAWDQFELADRKTLLVEHPHRMGCPLWVDPHPDYAPWSYAMRHSYTQRQQQADEEAEALQ